MASPPTMSLDPSAPGTIIRNACILENIFNIMQIIVILVSPSTLLSQLVSPQIPITPALETVMRIVGVFFIAVTIPLFFSVPNTVNGIETRKTTYRTFASAEIFMISFFFWASSLGEEATGMQPTSLKFTANLLLAFFLWRVFVLFGKPEWFGKYRLVASKKK